MTATPFETERLTMRALRADDAEALHELYSDSAAMTYWSHPPLADLTATRARLAERLDGADWRTWAITRTGEGAAIGTLGACEQRQGGVSEIGYSLVPGAWRRGYAREAVAGLIALLFGEGQRRVFADTDPDNAASNRLLETLGFTLEGRLRGAWHTHIGVRDSLIWGRLATDPGPDPTCPDPT